MAVLCSTIERRVNARTGKDSRLTAEDSLPETFKEGRFVGRHGVVGALIWRFGIGGCEVVCVIGWADLLSADE